MALFRGIFKDILKIPVTHYGSTSSSVVKSIHTSGYRLLFAPNALGIDKFNNMREKVIINFSNNAQEFKDKMNTCINLDAGVTSTEDLKNIIYLAQQDDIQLVMNMAKKYNKINSRIRFSSFNMGPLLMRLLYILDKPHEIIEAIHMKDFEGFFDQLISYQLAMDILYKNGLYEDTLKVFELVQNKRIRGLRYPKKCFTLALSSYYQMNTAESLKSAKDMFASAIEYGVVVNKRQICLLGYLCLRQCKPQDALTLLSTAHTTTHIAVVSLRIIALSEMDKIHDILQILQSFRQQDLPTNSDFRWNTNHRIVQEAIESGRQAVERSGNQEEKVEFKRIVTSLTDYHMISQKTIDEIITEEIIQDKLYDIKNQRHRKQLSVSFHGSRDAGHRKQHIAPRKGLFDME